MAIYHASRSEAQRAQWRQHDDLSRRPSSQRGTFSKAVDAVEMVE